MHRKSVKNCCCSDFAGRDECCTLFHLYWIADASKNSPPQASSQITHREQTWIIMVEDQDSPSLNTNISLSKCCILSCLVDYWVKIHRLHIKAGLSWAWMNVQWTPSNSINPKLLDPRYLLEENAKMSVYAESSADCSVTSGAASDGYGGMWHDDGTVPPPDCLGLSSRSAWA